MNRKSLIIVAFVTVIALIAAIAIHHSQKADSEVTSSARLLLPHLATHLNDVSEIRLATAGQKEIATFKRGDKGWLVTNRNSFPADAGRLREFILKLSDARTIEAKTKNPDLYSKLGVEDVTAPNAGGVLVELVGLPEKTALVIGNVNGGGGGGTFVRRMGDEQSWLIAGTLSVDRSTSEWIAKEIIDVPSSRIRTVVIEKDGKILRVSKSSGTDGNFVLQDIPKDRTPTNEFAANGLASTLSGLRVDDVSVAAQMPAPADAIKAQYISSNGIRVDATAWTVDDKHYAQFKASIDEVSANDWVGLEQAKQDAVYQTAIADVKTNGAAKPDATTADTVADDAPAEKPLALTDPAKDRDEKLTAIKAEVDRWNTGFLGWTFTLPAYKFDNINKGMDDLLLPAEDATAVPSKVAKSNAK